MNSISIQSASDRHRFQRWIDYFRRVDTLQTVWLEQNLTDDSLGLPDLILCEVLQGFRYKAGFQQARTEMTGCIVLPTGGEALAVAAAINYRLLRARDITIRKTIDCLIATFCIVEGHILLHNDRDFDPFEDHLRLQVLHPSSH